MFGCVCWLPLHAGFLLLIRCWGVPAVLPCPCCRAPHRRRCTAARDPARQVAGLAWGWHALLPPRRWHRAASASAPAPSAAPLSRERCCRAQLRASVLPRLPLERKICLLVNNGSRASAWQLGLHFRPCGGAGTSQRGCCHQGRLVVRSEQTENRSWVLPVSANKRNPNHLI